jgi:hypothetical protein
MRRQWTATFNGTASTDDFGIWTPPAALLSSTA